MLFTALILGILIRYRFDGKLLNLRRLQAKYKVQTDVLHGLVNAYGLVKNAILEANKASASGQNFTNAIAMAVQ